MAQPSIQSVFDPIAPVNKKKRDREKAQEEIFDEEEDDHEEMEEEDNEVFVSAKRFDDGQLEITTTKQAFLFDKRAADVAFAGLVGRHAAIGEHEAGHPARREVVDEVLHPGEVGVALGGALRTASARRRPCGTSRCR